MRKEIIFLGLIFILAVFLRTYNVEKTLLFHFDQGYHGLAIKEIWENKRIALLGHKTDVEGVYHGSLFYYLMIPFYLISSWNPAVVSILLGIFDSFSIVFLFLIGEKMFNQKIGLFAALFYAISYSLISYSRWLSNVTLIPFLATCLTYFLVKTYKEKSNYYPVTAFFVGLIIQFNGAIGFFFLPLLVFVFLNLHKKLLKEVKIVIFALFFFILPSLPLILFDFRHDFLVSRSILKMFSGDGKISYDFVNLFNHLNFFKNEVFSLLTDKTLVVGLLLIVFVILGLFLRKKSTAEDKKLLLLFFFIPTAGLIFYPKGIHQFFYVGILPLLILLIAVGLGNLSDYQKFKPPVYLLIIFVILLNINFWRGFLSPNFNLIPIGTRNLITLEDRIRATDFMYKEANGKTFKTLIYIIPYFQEQPWDYLFSWYGKSKYGYGREEKGGKTFVIYERDYDFPYRLTNWLGKIQEDHGKVEASFKSNDLIVELREK